MSSSPSPAFFYLSPLRIPPDHVFFVVPFLQTPHKSSRLLSATAPSVFILGLSPRYRHPRPLPWHLHPPVLSSLNHPSFLSSNSSSFLLPPHIPAIHFLSQLVQKEIKRINLLFFSIAPSRRSKSSSQTKLRLWKYCFDL